MLTLGIRRSCEAEKSRLWLNNLFKGLRGPTVWTSPDADGSSSAGKATFLLYGDALGDLLLTPAEVGECGTLTVLRRRDKERIRPPRRVGDDARETCVLGAGGGPSPSESWKRSYSSLISTSKIASYRSEALDPTSRSRIGTFFTRLEKLL